MGNFHHRTMTTSGQCLDQVSGRSVKNSTFKAKNRVQAGPQRKAIYIDFLIDISNQSSAVFLKDYQASRPLFTYRQAKTFNLKSLIEIRRIYFKSNTGV